MIDAAKFGYFPPELKVGDKSLDMVLCERRFQRVYRIKEFIELTY